MNLDASDHAIRSHAFQWLGAQKLLHGEVLPRDLLAQGFQFEGQRVPIIGPQGIFRPKVMRDMPLSITTIPGGPYDDDLRDGASAILYRYRGTDPQHPENVGLRRAMQTQTPLVFCYRTMPGSYLVSYPVFVQADHPGQLSFEVFVDDDIRLSHYIAEDAVEPLADAQARRRYITSVTKHRLHQAAFRDRVLAAYESRCALCRLGHAGLLDAAHIVPDTEPDGHPLVSNGLSLCKIHHAAYDQNFLGIRPDFKVEVKLKLLDEVDGPMLQHGIKAMHGAQIVLPRAKVNRPDPGMLEWRFERFLSANS